jgi:cysteine synthase
MSHPRDENDRMPSVASSVLLAIGNTPLIRLIRVVPPGAADVLVKLE